MIEFVILKDFQSHKETMLKMDPLFNIIVGPSGNGKSSIIRALRCIAFNHIGTSEVRLPDAKSYHLEVGVNGHIIEKDKGSSVNSYTIDKNTTLIDVNKDVPVTVQHLLNIKKIELDSSCDIDVQFSSQLDGPFMLSEKDSVKMKFLNTLSGTNAVDLAAKKANAIVKDNARTVKTTESELKTLKATEKVLQEQLTDVTDKVNFLKKAKETLDSLEELLKTFQGLKQQSDFLFDEYRKLNIFDQAMQKLNIPELEQKISLFSELLGIQNDCIQLKNQYNVIKRAAELLNSVDTAWILDKIGTIVKLIEVQKERDSLKNVYLQHNLHEKQILEQLNTTISVYKNELKKQKSCPICGNSITDECLDKIIQSL